MGGLWQIVAEALFALPALIGIILIGTMARGSARVLGMIGCIVLLLGNALGAVWAVMLPQLMRESGLPIAMVGILSAVIRLISMVGLILVICAVVAGRKKAPGPQQPRPVPPQQPYQPYGQQPGPHQSRPNQPGPHQPSPHHPGHQQPYPFPTGQQQPGQQQSGPHQQQPGGPYQPGPQ